MAAPAASPWRFIVGASLASSSLETAYMSRYSPPFLYTTYTSAATQVLPLDSGAAPGVLLAIERDLAPHLGLQLSAGYAAADVTGDAGRYELTVQYVSRPPPFYEPIELEQRRSLEWPPAEGRLKSFVLALDVAAWAPLGARGRIGVLAGPAWLRSRGEARSLAYTVYRMGGHSTSFYEDHLVSFTFPADALALDAGAFVEIGFGPHAGLRLDARYTWAAERDAEATVENVVNAGEIVNGLTAEEIQRGLQPPSVRLDPSVFRASVAVVLRF